MDQTSRIFAAAAGQDQPFATTKFANMLVDPYSTNDITVYGNTVVVVGDFNDNIVGVPANLCYSTDGGTTWESKSLTDPSASNQPYSFSSVTVNTATGQFFVLGKSQFGSVTLLTSTNGIAWSKVDTYSSAGTGGTITFFPSGPYQYVAFDTLNNVRTSSDGITWTTRSALPGFGNFAAFGNSFFIVGGNGFLRRTADFITYTTPTINELTGGLTEANFIFNGGIYKGNTFIVSAYVNATSLVTYCLKSTNNGANFNLSNTSEGYYENANLGLFVNSSDVRSQSYVSGLFTISTAPNRGDALTFSGATYSLRTRKNAVITTTTGSLGTNGLSELNSTDTTNVAPITNSFTRSTTGLGLGTISLNYASGSWRITYTSTSISGGSSVVTGIAAPNFNANILTKYQTSGEAITGYPFVLNNTFIVFFPNAFYDIGSGTRYSGTTAYYSTDLTTWTQVTTLPAAFNVSGANSSFGAGRNLVIVRGEFGGGGYIFAYSVGFTSGGLGGMYSPTLVTFTAFSFNQPISWAPVYSANDGTGSAGWVVMVGGSDFANPDPASTSMIAEPTNNYALWSNRYFVTGLDGTTVRKTNFTDASYINGQFRFFCTFTNLLGTLVPGVISMTTAGVLSHTIISGFSNIKVLGRANNTLYVINTGTGEVLSSTDGTTYTSRFFWNQPFVSGRPVYLDTTSTAYTSGSLLDSTTFRPSTGQTNWFTSINGSTWTKTAVTSPTSAEVAVRNVLPNKYALATSGNYVGIAKGFNASSSGYLSVATSGSLSNMPYKRLVTYAVPMFTPSPVFYNATLAQYCSISAYYGASATSTNGLVWSLNSGNFDVNTSTLVTGFSGNYSYYTYAASAKLFYRFAGDVKYYAADPSTPTTYSLFSFPTIGTSYTGSLISNIAFDGTTYMTVYNNSGTLNSFTSTDGASWLAAGNGTFSQNPTLISGTTGSFLVYSTQSTSGAFTSNTGSTWTSGINFNFAASTIGATNGYIYYQAAYGNGTYVMVGWVQGVTTTGPPFFFPIYTNYKRISTSSNGTTWTSVYPSTTTVGTFYAVTFTNLGSGFFIAGAIGIGVALIEYSNTNGTTWTAATINGTPSNASVFEIIDGGASASPRFVAVTNSTEVLTSDNGINWNIVTLAAVVNSGYVSFLNGRWILTSVNNNSNNLVRCAILTSG